MNTSITIYDTHAAVQRLQSKGASPELAEEIVATVKSAKIEASVATQKDINDLRSDVLGLKAEMYRAFIIHGFSTVGAILAAAFAVAGVMG